MQFTSTTLFALAALAATVYADMHSAAICVDWAGKSSFYNEAATKKACADYLARTVDSPCPDCTYVEAEPAHCESNGWHLDGDKTSAYCKAAGADGSLAD